MSDQNNRKSVGEWLSRPFVWRIPVYQRHYAWDLESEIKSGHTGPIHLFWETIEEQTLSRLQDKKTRPHYLGAVLVDNKTERGATDGITRYDVVDGQQRLTTIQIAMLALGKVAENYYLHEEIKAESKKYLFFDEENKRSRLEPFNFDNKQFQALLFDIFPGVIMDFGINGVPEKNARKSKIVSTFQFFRNKYTNFLEEVTKTHKPHKAIHTILNVLVQGFDIVLIVMDEQDNPQQVFESLNNYSKPLNTFDLIRNKIFYRASEEDEGLDIKYFRTHTWQQLEDPYWEESSERRRNGTPHIQAYVAKMLVANMGKRVHFNRNEIFNAYKKFTGNIKSSKEEIEALVQYADAYRYLDGKTDQNPIGPDISFGVFMYREWKNRDFYPVMFSIIGSTASVAEKQNMLQLMESYIIRRNVCEPRHAIDNRQLTAMAICEKLHNQFDYANLDSLLKKGQKDIPVLPDDDRVQYGCVRNWFYGSPVQQYIFQMIEESLHDQKMERIKVEDGILTVDHILPKGWLKNEKWRNMILGESGGDIDAFRTELSIDSIGNLTLMSNTKNEEKANLHFDEIKHLLASSTVKLNQGLAKESEWNLDKIRERSKWIAEKICEIWPYDID